MTEVHRTVTVGGEPKVLARFRSYKVTLALDIMGGVTDQVGDLLDAVTTARREYGKANPIRISRGLCMERSAELKRAAEEASKKASTTKDAKELEELEATAAMLTDRAAVWERQLEDMGDKEFIENPGSMPEEQEILVALPYALKMRKQFTQLIGLTLIEDSELEQAWVTDEVFKVIEAHGQQTLFKMEAGEEVELIVAARSLFQEQLRPRKGALDQLRGLREWWKGGPKDKDEKKDKDEEKPEATEEQEPGADTSQTSSTPSPDTPDGPPETSSLASPTTST
jgi:hypothetical protein